jgi:hypothetical protein
LQPPTMKEAALYNESAALEDAIGEVGIITKLEGDEDPLNWSALARCKHQLLSKWKEYRG